METLWILTAAFVVIFADIVAVPFAVDCLGERHFSPPGMDGCAIIAWFLLATPLLPLTLESVGWSIGWAWPFLFLLVTVSKLLWLWWSGRGGRRRGWRVIGGRVLGRSGESMAPTYLRVRHFTFDGGGISNHFDRRFIDIYNDEQKLGTNGYNPSSEFERDLHAIELALPLRRLDFCLISRFEERKWRFFEFDGGWAKLLCGPLGNLGVEGKDWWRQWLLPKFETLSEVIIDTADWTQHLGELRDAYPTYWKDDYETYKKETPWGMRRLLEDWDERLAVLEWILATPEVPVLAVRLESFERLVTAQTGNGSRITDYTREPTIYFYRDR